MTFKINQGLVVRCETYWLPFSGLMECWRWPHNYEAWWKSHTGEGTAMRGRAWVSCLTLWWLCHHVTCANLARCIASQISAISSSTWRVDQGHLLFLPSETLLYTSHHLWPCFICKWMSYNEILRSLTREASEQEEWRHLWEKEDPCFFHRGRKSLRLAWP